MTSPRTRRPACPRRGAAAAELAILLPLLAFLVAVGCDYARILYFSQTVTNAARNGALWQSDPYAQKESPYKTVAEAALADAGNLSDPNNKPTVATGTGTDSTGTAYVEVTVGYQFHSLTNMPGVPKTVNLARSVRVAKAPVVPGSNP